MNPSLKNQILGGIAGAIFDFGIDWVIAAVNNNQLPVLQYITPDGVYIWGIGAGDALGLGVGGGLWFLGKRSTSLRGEKIKDFGKGWTLSIVTIKAVEAFLGLYGYVKHLYPIQEVPIMGVGQFNIDYAFPNTNLIRYSHRAASPYVTKSERLPFQTDIGY